MLAVSNVQINYDNVIEAVREASLRVGPGEIVTLLGSNGAGKSTILKGISGVLYPEEGEIIGGTITFDGESLVGRRPDEIVRAGIIMVPEGRQLFEPLTVEENLLMGGITRDRAEVAESLERVFTIFPRVRQKRAAIAGYLSGGEQQMVAIGRALMQSPKLIMFDEPSLGLSPILVQEVFRVIEELHSQGLTIFLVEQNVHQTLKIADYCYVMENGRIVKEGTGKDLEKDASIRETYLGF